MAPSSSSASGGPSPVRPAISADRAPGPPCPPADTTPPVAERRWSHPANFIGGPILALLLLAVAVAPGRGLDVAGLATWLMTALPLVIAAIGQTQIVLGGGQGLAAGSTALLINALIAAHLGDDAASVVLWSLAGIGLGTALGAATGVLVGFCRLPSTAVTLAIGFIALGLTLAVVDGPASALPPFGHLPAAAIVAAPFAVLVLLLIAALALDRSALGRGFRAVGRGGWSAVNRRSAAWVAGTYIIAGMASGFGGAFSALAFGMPDPASGALSLIEIYLAVGLGGSIPYVCQGSTTGAVSGALSVAAFTYVATLYGAPDWAAPVAGSALLLVVLRAGGRRMGAAAVEPPTAEARRYPVAWFALPILVAAITLDRGDALFGIDSVVFATIAMLALAQAMVVMTGHVDMSLPAMTAFAGLATVALGQGQDARLAWLVPGILLLGAATGLGTGLLGIACRVPRVLVTLAVSGILAALSIQVSLSFPYGFAPPALVRFLTPGSNGLTPALPVMLGLLAIGFLAFALPKVRAWTRSLGAANLPTTTRRGVPFIHAGAGLLAAMAGIVLAGYGGKSPISGGDPFFLPSLLAVEAAGLTVGRRGGSLSALIASVPTVVILDTLLLGTGLGYAGRMSFMGALFLLAIVIHGMPRPGLSLQGKKKGGPIPGASSE